MSMPRFPFNPKDMTRDDVINQIVSSVAMEELGLSHILNAEGEKLQYVLGTLTGSSGINPTIDELLRVNESVQQTLASTVQSQMFLHNKMSEALNVSNMYGPTGPTGPTGLPLDPTTTIFTLGLSGLGAMGATNTIDFKFQDNLYIKSDTLDVSLIPGSAYISIESNADSIPAPTISATGTWVINGVDTGLPSRGATGADGTAIAMPVVSALPVMSNLNVNNVNAFYYKNAFGEVTVYGSMDFITPAAMNAPIGNLPDGYWPSNTLLVPATFTTQLGDTFGGYLQVLPDGTINAVSTLPPTPSTVTVSGVVFNFTYLAASAPLTPLQVAVQKVSNLNTTTVTSPISDPAANAEAIANLTNAAQALLGPGSPYTVVFVPSTGSVIVPNGTSTGTLNGYFTVTNPLDAADSASTEPKDVAVTSKTSPANIALQLVDVPTVDIGNISITGDPLAVNTAILDAVQAAQDLVDAVYTPGTFVVAMGESMISPATDPRLEPITAKLGYLHGCFIVTSLSDLSDIAYGPQTVVTVTSTYVSADPLEAALGDILNDPISLTVPLDDPTALGLASAEAVANAAKYMPVLGTGSYDATFTPTKIVPTSLTTGNLYGKYTVTYSEDSTFKEDPADRMIPVSSTLPSTGSIATADFLSGSLMGTDLESILSIGGVTATFINGLTTGTENVVQAPLDLGLFNGQLLTLPSGLELPIGKLLMIGAANNYAKAMIDGNSFGYSGAVSNDGGVAVGMSPSAPDGATLDLLALVGGPNEILSKLQIVIGAIIGAANYSQKVGTPITNTADLINLNQQQGYNVARDKSDIVSPLIGGIVDQIYAMTTPISTAVNGLLDPVIAAVKAALNTLAGTLSLSGLTISGIDGVTANVSVDLSTLLSPVFANEIKLVGDTITLSLPEGRVSKDMRILNDLPPNSPVLGTEIITSVLNLANEIVSGLTGEIDLLMTDILDSIMVTISGNVTVTGTVLVVPVNAAIAINYSGTLNALIANPSLLTFTLSGTGLTVVQPVLNTLLSTIVGTLTPFLVTVEGSLGTTVQGVIDTAMAAIETSIFTPLDGLLTPIGALLNLMVNVQDEPVPGQYLEIPLQLSIAGGTVAEINLGKTTVGTNYYTAGTVFPQV